MRKALDEASKHAAIVLQIGPARLEIGHGADQTTLSNVLLAFPLCQNTVGGWTMNPSGVEIFLGPSPIDLRC